MTCYLARIDTFPVKSLDGVSVDQATVLASGALEGDRTYALTSPALDLATNPSRATQDTGYDHPL